MQQSDAYILKSELALRRHAVLMHEVPPAKRQRIADSCEAETCARQYAYVPDSPLSPSRNRSQVTVEEPTGLIEVTADLPEEADISESPSPSAEEFLIKTQSEVDAAQQAAEQAPVKAEEAVDPLLSSDLAPQQHVGLPVSDDIKQESSTPVVAAAQGVQHPDVAHQDMLLQHMGLPVDDDIKQESKNAVAALGQGAQHLNVAQQDTPLQHADLPDKLDAKQESSIAVAASAQRAQQHDAAQQDIPLPHADLLVKDEAKQEINLPGAPSAQGHQESNVQQDIPPPVQAREHSVASDQHSVSKQATTENYSTSMPSNTSQATVDRDTVHQSVASPAEAEKLQPANAEQQGDVIAEAQQTEAAAAAQPVNGASQPMTVEQIVAQGQYNVDSTQQQKVAVNLETYKRRVDELQSQGKVRQQTHLQKVI